MTPTDKAKTRILAQDKVYPKNVDFLTAMPKVAETAYQACLDIQDILSIDSSKNLNLIGRVIDQDRTVIVDQKMEVVRFGVDKITTYLNQSQYGRSQYGNAQYSRSFTVEAKHRSGDSSSRSSAKSIKDDSGLSDEYYRHLLRAKVSKNNSEATYDGIISAVKFIAPGADIVEIIDSEDMTFGIRIYGKISGVERNILNQKGIIPEPQGVKYNGYAEIFDLTRVGDTLNRAGDTSAQSAGYKGATNNA
tara:strand:- start:7468 stop:8211 length:744 start_codon:yes stop_codon:yes gene_type:complete